MTPKLLRTFVGVLCVSLSVLPVVRAQIAVEDEIPCGDTFHGGIEFAPMSDRAYVSTGVSVSRIHVVDLAKGHLAALDYACQHQGEFTVNLGTGNGYSVLDMVRAFEKASGRPVPYEISPRRAGDIATCYADPAHAKALLGWQAAHGIEEMCADGWRWQSNNPNGYNDSTEVENAGELARA